VIAVVVNLCLNLILIWPLGSGGLALSTSISSYLQVAILMTVLARKYGRIVVVGFSSSVFKTLLGTALMIITGLAVLAGTQIFLKTGSRMQELIGLCAVVSAAGGIYLATAWMTKNPMLALIVSRRRRSTSTTVTE
jgi:putative peptidoglycan lipid II flippase